MTMYVVVLRTCGLIRDNYSTIKPNKHIISNHLRKQLRHTLAGKLHNILYLLIRILQSPFTFSIIDFTASSNTTIILSTNFSYSSMCIPRASPRSSPHLPRARPPAASAPRFRASYICCILSRESLFILASASAISFLPMLVFPAMDSTAPRSWKTRACWSLRRPFAISARALLRSSVARRGGGCSLGG